MENGNFDLGKGESCTALVVCENSDVGQAQKYEAPREILAEILLIDVNPRTVGMEFASGVMMPVIPRNTCLPARKTVTVSSYSDSNCSIGVYVYEGEGDLARDNHHLGSYDIQGVPPMPRGVARVEITFDIDWNGILTLSAVETSTFREYPLQLVRRRR